MTARRAIGAISLFLAACDNGEPTPTAVAPTVPTAGGSSASGAAGAPVLAGQAGAGGSASGGTSSSAGGSFPGGAPSAAGNNSGGSDIVAGPPGPPITFTEFAIPTPSQPGWLAAGSDDHVWFTHQSTAPPAITKASKDGTQFDLFKVASTRTGPRGMVAGPDGKVWYAKQGGVANITSAGVVVEYPAPNGGDSAGIALGPDGNLWFTQQLHDRISRVTPDGKFTDFALPNPMSGALAITLGPDKNLWFTESAATGNRIGRITPDGMIARRPRMRLGTSAHASPSSSIEPCGANSAAARSAAGKLRISATRSWPGVGFSGGTDCFPLGARGRATAGSADMCWVAPGFRRSGAHAQPANFPCAPARPPFREFLCVAAHGSRRRWEWVRGDRDLWAALPPPTEKQAIMRTALLLVSIAIAGCTAEITGPSGGATSGPPGNPANPGGAGSGGAAMTPGGQPLSEGPSPRFIRQLTLSEYNKTVADLLYLKDPDTTRVPPDVSLKGFTTNVAAAFVSETHLDAYVAVGMSLAERAVQESFSKLVPCTTQDDACAAQFVDSFGLRAFRRPLAADEKTRYLGLFQPSLTGGDFKQGVSLVISAMLASPNFLFRSELGQDVGGGRFQLTAHEIAAALSYTYWGTMPDDALLASASRGDLAKPAEVEAQVRRLLADPRGRAHIGDFFFEWTESARAYVASKDLSVYANRFKSDADVDAMVTAMKAEEDAFINHVVFDSTKKFSELFTANYTFANDRLAAYYGLAAPGTGETPSKVTINAGSARGGLLTLGMFLFGHARTDQSSPVQRGHLIRSNVFCSEVPPPPPGVDATVKPGTPGKTGRAQIEALTGSGQCPACHSLLNPVGFALEAFGSAAEERATDNGEPVDTSGQLKSVVGLAEAVSFSGARELSSIIATSTQAQACLASSYHRYARGFAARNDDAGAVQKLSDQFVKENLDLPELFVRVALQDSFTSRRSVEVLEQ